jgi:hypothetical protein
MGEMRTFSTGATRDTEQGKLDYEGFLSPIVLERYAQYLHKHRVQSDGNLRDSDNWQKGISKDTYMKSAWRHFMDWWGEHRGIHTSEAGIEDAMMGLLFNVMGYAYEHLRKTTPETAPGYGEKPEIPVSKRNCSNCGFENLPSTDLECNGCCGTFDHKNWTPKNA